MKKILIVASCLAISACGEPATPEAEAPAVEEVAAVEGAGTWDYAAEDGSFSGRTVMNEDGTFTNTDSDGTESAGTWRAGDNGACFTGSEEGAEEVCWTDGKAADDGSFTSTSPDGVVVNVAPATMEAEAE